MKLHTDKQLFSEAIRITAYEMGIAEEFVEKDYWICLILQNLSRHRHADQMVWKGGTSLSKAYGIIKRFSSDVDFAVLTEGLSPNQQKRLLIHIDKDTTSELTDMEVPGQTIKNSRFRRTFHAYNTVIDKRNNRFDFLGNHVVVEINTYGNPYPYERCSIKSFITEMMERRGMDEMIEAMDMKAFVINVLDKRRTLCEKVVSLLRFSFENDPTKGLTSKIRHFYDLHFLMQDPVCQEYLRSDFVTDLPALIDHDKCEFNRPLHWHNSDITTSVLLTDFDACWQSIRATYLSELGALSYGEIPTSSAISTSMRKLLKTVAEIIDKNRLK